MSEKPIIDAARLAELRVLCGLSQTQLAERALVSREAIERIEQGATRRPHAATVKKLAAALGCETSALWVAPAGLQPEVAALPAATEPVPVPAPRAPASWQASRPLWRLVLPGGALLALGLLAGFELAQRTAPDPGAAPPGVDATRVALPEALPEAQSEATVPESARRPALLALDGGRFLMGNPESSEGHYEFERQHPVRVSGFLMARTEVTQGQYAAVMGERTVQRDFEMGDLPKMCALAGIGNHLPVVCLTWLEAARYCNRLSEIEGVEPAYAFDETGIVRWNPASPGYRLPTEAEWEYAARAGSVSPFVGADRPEDACDHANVFDLAWADQFRAKTTLFSFPCNDGDATLAAVDREDARPNGFGLLGMGGNAAEWVWDFAAPYTDQVLDPRGPESGTNRVIRGASWLHMRNVAHVSVRIGEDPERYFPMTGFRIARSDPDRVRPDVASVGRE